MSVPAQATDARQGVAKSSLSPKKAKENVEAAMACLKTRRVTDKRSPGYRRELIRENAHLRVVAKAMREMLG